MVIYMDILKKISDYIEKENMFEEYDSVIVGVSGGADSMCLLTAIYELYSKSKNIVAVHINHGLRENAIKEAEYVRNYCDSLKIKCVVKEVDVKKLVEEKGLSTEEAGRILRYEAFEEISNQLSGKKCIALAHNMEDNAETLLLNMFRGSSLQGICGIRPVRDNIVRPILCLRRAEIEKFLAYRNIEYCTDESNLTDEYARNRVRHHILPFATENINSEAIAHMNNLSRHMIMATDYIELQIDEAINNSVVLFGDVAEIKGDILLTYHPFIIRGLVYKVFGTIAGKLKDVEEKHIDILLSLFDCQTGKRVNLPYGVHGLRTYSGIRIYKEKNVSINTSSEDDVCVLDTDGKICFKNISIEYRVFQKESEYICMQEYTKWFDYDKISDTVVVRKRLEGDYLTIDSNNRQKSLKKYFVDEKVPGYMRDDIPLICSGSHVMWVVGKRISNYFKVTDETKNILEIKVL